MQSTSKNTSNHSKRSSGLRRRTRSVDQSIERLLRRIERLEQEMKDGAAVIDVADELCRVGADGYDATFLWDEYCADTHHDRALSLLNAVAELQEAATQFEAAVEKLTRTSPRDSLTWVGTPVETRACLSESQQQVRAVLAGVERVCRLAEGTSFEARVEMLIDRDLASLGAPGLVVTCVELSSALQAAIARLDDDRRQRASTLMEALPERILVLERETRSAWRAGELVSSDFMATAAALGQDLELLNAACKANDEEDAALCQVLAEQQHRLAEIVGRLREVETRDRAVRNSRWCLEFGGISPPGGDAFQSRTGQAAPLFSCDNAMPDRRSARARWRSGLHA
jgi:hypothetical protein